MKKDNAKDWMAEIEHWAKEEVKLPDQLANNLTEHYRRNYAKTPSVWRVPAWVAAGLLLVGLGLGTIIGPIFKTKTEPIVMEKVIYQLDTIYLPAPEVNQPALALEEPPKKIEAKPTTEDMIPVERPEKKPTPQKALVAKSQNAAESEDVLELTGRVW